MQARRTKIVATYGPAIQKDEVLREVLKAGVNVVRFNFSHGDHEAHRAGIEQVRRMRDELGVSLGILMDTKGPEIRTGARQEENEIWLPRDSEVVLDTRDVPNTAERLHIDFPQFAVELPDDAKVFVDDGNILLLPLSKTDTEVRCKVAKGGTVKKRRGVNVPGVEFSLPALSKKDEADLEFSAAVNADYVALSFVRSATDVKRCRDFLIQCNHSRCGIISKIENPFAVKNIAEIIEASDGVMVARGDLGVELPVEDVPMVQKQIVTLCREAGKPVIIATQMLESMTTHSRPTRAEVSDVANAIYDLTSATMLSGETAGGDYPVECVNIMARIAQKTENEVNYAQFAAQSCVSVQNTTAAIAKSAVATACDVKASAILCVTLDGGAARAISQARPMQPIIGVCESKQTFHRMSLYWGVRPMMIPEKPGSLEELFERAMETAKRENLIQSGDRVILVGGSPIGRSGGTNMLRVSVVQE